ncbi:hypothetical protein CsatA_008052 [Cannabis sativa]
MIFKDLFCYDCTIYLLPSVIIVFVPICIIFYKFNAFSQSQFELSFTILFLCIFYLGIRAGASDLTMSTNQSQTPNPATPGNNNGASLSSNPEITTNRHSAQSNHNNNFTQPFNTLNQPFPLKLDRNNYTLWKTMVSTIIRGHRLDGFVHGTRVCPTEFISVNVDAGEEGTEAAVQINPDFEHWVVSDQLLMGWLYSSMTEAIATEVMGCTTSASLWRALENLYGAHSKSKMDDTRTAIQTVRKGNTTMVEYLRQKKAWADSLALAGDPYPENHLIANVLSGLDANYLPIVLQIEARISTSWQQLQELLLSFDSKIERLQNLNGVPKTTAAPTANLADRTPHGGRGRGQTSFQNNTSSRGNHSNNSRGGNSRGRGRGRFNNNNNSRPTCQVCGKFGHSAAVCYNRYDEAYMGTDPHNNQTQNKAGPSAYVATPEIVDSDVWYADSGASNHVTSDGSNMNQKREYGGQGHKEGTATRDA